MEFEASPAPGTADAARAAAADTTEATRRPRADGLRNRAALLEAARHLLTTGGAADVRSISLRAGVGVGTLFRHFATRDELVDAVLSDDIERWNADATAAVEEAGNPYEQLAAFLRCTLERQLTTPGLPRVYMERWGPDTMGRVGTWYSELIDQLVAQCHAAGEVREDLTSTDVDGIVVAVGHLVVDRPAQARRHLEIALAGLREGRTGAADMPR